MKGFRVCGAPEALRLALDRIHVLVPVRGVLVGDEEFEVYPEGDLPALAGVTVVPVPIPEVAQTGLEQDGPIHVGQSILVRPPWVAAPRGFDAIVPEDDLPQLCLLAGGGRRRLEDRGQRGSGVRGAAGNPGR